MKMISALLIGSLLPLSLAHGGYGDVVCTGYVNYTSADASNPRQDIQIQMAASENRSDPATVSRYFDGTRERFDFTLHLDRDATDRTVAHIRLALNNGTHLRDNRPPYGVSFQANAAVTRFTNVPDYGTIRLAEPFEFSDLIFPQSELGDIELATLPRPPVAAPVPVRNPRHRRGAATPAPQNRRSRPSTPVALATVTAPSVVIHPMDLVLRCTMDANQTESNTLSNNHHDPVIHIQSDAGIDSGSIRVYEPTDNYDIEMDAAAGD